LSNIKLKLLIEPELATEEEHIYAKVIQKSHVDEHLFLLRFPDVPLKMIAILNVLCQPG
jgi:adenylate cyclase